MSSSPTRRSTTRDGSASRRTDPRPSRSTHVSRPLPLASARTILPLIARPPRVVDYLTPLLCGAVCLGIQLIFGLAPATLGCLKTGQVRDAHDGGIQMINWLRTALHLLSAMLLLLGATIGCTDGVGQRVRLSEPRIHPVEKAEWNDAQRAFHRQTARILIRQGGDPTK